LTTTWPAANSKENEIYFYLLLRARITTLLRRRWLMPQQVKPGVVLENLGGYQKKIIVDDISLAIPPAK
jgi:hypothetical protein